MDQLPSKLPFSKKRLGARVIISYVSVNRSRPRKNISANLAGPDSDIFSTMFSSCKPFPHDITIPR